MNRPLQKPLQNLLSYTRIRESLLLTDAVVTLRLVDESEEDVSDRFPNV